MPHLLHLDSSADPTHSASRAVTARFADAWREIGPDHVVTYRDLHRNALPHIPTSAVHWAPHLRTADEVVPAETEELQQKLIAELVSADVLLVGAPMYNWSVPSTLKAWIDYIHVPGTTVPFGDDTRPVAGRPAVVVTSRGNEYGPGTPGDGADHTTAQLRQVLGTALGMHVHVVTVDLTLAERVPAMSEARPRARASYDGALTTAADLAHALGVPG